MFDDEKKRCIDEKKKTARHIDINSVGLSLRSAVNIYKKKSPINGLERFGEQGDMTIDKAETRRQGRPLLIP